VLAETWPETRLPQSLSYARYCRLDPDTMLTAWESMCRSPDRGPADTEGDRMGAPRSADQQPEAAEAAGTEAEAAEAAGTEAETDPENAAGESEPGGKHAAPGSKPAAAQKPPAGSQPDIKFQG
jgi:hypothetical protein